MLTAWTDLWFFIRVGRKLVEATQPSAVAADPRRGLTLDQVLGNEAARAFLRRAHERGQLPHALLLSGPAGVGKTTLAWALVREIVAGGGDPATDPRALKVARGVHPDVIEITGKDSVSATIRVDDIRDLDRRVYTAPLESPLKIVLIEPADRMNDAAANCLLKLLEEPPPRLLFLLITPEPGRLLETIRSRCASLRLDPAPLEPLVAWLIERRGLDGEQARLVAMLSEGRPGYALSLCEAGILDQRVDLLEALGLLKEEGFAVLFQVADRFLAANCAIEDALLGAMTLMRDALVVEQGEARLLNFDLRDPLRAFASDLPAESLLAVAERLEQAAHEAPYFYTPTARAHFIEVVLSDVGRRLRS